MDIKWKVEIVYSLTDDATVQRYKKVYKVNAQNMASAESIASEIFYAELHNGNIIEVFAEPEGITEEDLVRMLTIKNKAFAEVASRFRGMSYDEFILSYRDFDGFSFKLSTTEDSSFWFIFMGLTLKAVYTVDEMCYIDNNEVYYTGSSGRTIVARNNWTEFYYVVG